MLRFLTAGESHGRGLTATLEGLPAGLRVEEAYINAHLARRMVGYGRGGRMRIEADRAAVNSGLAHGVTTGAPVSLWIENRDWRQDDPDITRPRPGHADLAGALKYGFDEVGRVAERSSARETAARVAVGALCLRLLEEFGVVVFSHVVEIGEVAAGPRAATPALCDWDAIRARAEASALRCADPSAEDPMKAAIDAARERGDTLGGVFEVVATGLPPGLGSHVHWDRRIDARLAAALVSVHAVKGVEFGLGFEAASTPGSAAHDEIFHSAARGFYRETNRAGGIEGGMTTGEPLVARAAMKPLPTLRAPLRSVDLRTKEPAEAAVIRGDVCAVPAAGVVAEAMTAYVLADALLEKFGGDAMAHIRRAHEEFVREARRAPGKP